MRLQLWKPVRGAWLLLVMVIGLVQAFRPGGLRPHASQRALSGASRVGAPLVRLDSAILGGGYPAEESVSGSSALAGVKVVELKRPEDLRTAAAVCVEAFFGEADSKLNFVKKLQLQTLQDEQLADLKGRFRMGPKANRMMMAVDAQGVPLGFVEVYVEGGMKYGLGPGVPLRDLRPYLANLAVRPACRRLGVGKLLVRAAEDVVRRWGYDEMILEVEEGNAAARRLYNGLGYQDVWKDNGGRKYDISGIGIKSIRVTNVGMRKSLSLLAAPNPLAALFGRLQGA